MASPCPSETMALPDPAWTRIQSAKGCGPLLEVGSEVDLVAVVHRHRTVATAGAVAHRDVLREGPHGTPPCTPGQPGKSLTSWLSPHGTNIYPRPPRRDWFILSAARGAARVRRIHAQDKQDHFRLGPDVSLRLRAGPGEESRTSSGTPDTLRKHAASPFSGKATEVTKLPFMSQAFYELDDGSGTIVVVSQKALPPEGKSVFVRGKVESAFKIGGQTYGRVVMEG